MFFKSLLYRLFVIDFTFKSPLKAFFKSFSVSQKRRQCGSYAFPRALFVTTCLLHPPHACLSSDCSFHAPCLRVDLLEAARLLSFTAAVLLRYPWHCNPTAHWLWSAVFGYYAQVSWLWLERTWNWALELGACRESVDLGTMRSVHQVLREECGFVIIALLWLRV